MAYYMITLNPSLWCTNKYDLRYAFYKIRRRLRSNLVKTMDIKGLSCTLYTVIFPWPWEYRWRCAMLWGFSFELSLAPAAHVNSRHISSTLARLHCAQSITGRYPQPYFTCSPLSRSQNEYIITYMSSLFSREITRSTVVVSFALGR